MTCTPVPWIKTTFHQNETLESRTMLSKKFSLILILILILTYKFEFDCQQISLMLTLLTAEQIKSGEISDYIRDHLFLFLYLFLFLFLFLLYFTFRFDEETGSQDSNGILSHILQK